MVHKGEREEEEVGRKRGRREWKEGNGGRERGGEGRNVRINVGRGKGKGAEG